MAFKSGNDTSEVLWGTNDATGDYIYGLGGNDTIEAGNGGDRLYGNTGNDKLYGQGGDDTLDGWSTGQGDDLLDGGDGYDTADYSGAPNAVTVSLSKGTAKGADVGSDTLWAIDNVVGGEGGDIIVGDSPGPLGVGGLGANMLDGRGGHDNLYGHGGNDTLYGGAGIDGLNGGDGDDQLYGQDDNDWLRGDAGNDQLYGGYGDDVLRPGTGWDHVDGGPGTDTVDYSDAVDDYWEAGVQIIGGKFGGSEGGTLVSVENLIGSPFRDIVEGDILGVNTPNRIEGRDGNDWIYGQGGNDTLLGGGGGDALWGGAGLDVLTGGGGSDAFFFERFDSGVGAGSRDVVTDFEQGVDKLGFSNGGDQSVSLAFMGANAFTGPDQVRFAYENGNTVVQVNFDTDSVPEIEVQLSGVVTLTAGDFYHG